MDENVKEKPQEGSVKKESDRPVTISYTTKDGTKSENVAFNTPDILELVRGYPEDAVVRIAMRDGKPDEDPRILMDKPKSEAVAELEASVLTKERLETELRNFTRMLFGHSKMRAIGVHAIIEEDEGSYGGFGFVVTSGKCTAEHAVALVNSGDANMDEFVSKTGIKVPGRDKDDGEIIAPTQEQIEKLG